MKKIIIESKSIGKVYMELTDENPETAKKFLKLLPLEGKAKFWGEEIYFEIKDLEVESENPRKIVKEGEVGIWIEEPSLCIFFGKTPISKGNEIIPYSDVNVIGKIAGDYKIFKNVKKGEKIKIYLEED